MKQDIQVSIIIPTYNEAENITRLVLHLTENSLNQVAEVIVVDGGSTDNTLTAASAAGAVALLSPKKGRAAQMNLGVKHATGNLLYFVHADSWPPATYVVDIQQALAEGYSLGSYRFKFRSEKLMLRLNSYCTRFDRIMCRGGDQTLFVERAVFEKLGGYKNDYVIMEEYDFIIRARKEHAFKIIPKDVLVSARKYDHNGYLRVNVANLTVFLMYFAGCSQSQMLQTYKKMIHHPKF